MCRIAGYVGTPVPLSRLLYEPPSSLERQSYLPREMISGHVNVDGTGVVWWPDGDEEPLRYVSVRPPWADANLPELSHRLSGSPILAVVRSATPGIPAGIEGVHPFAHGDLAGSHNGYLPRFRDRTAWSLLERLPSDLRARVDVLSDSLLLFLLVVSERRQRGRERLRESVVAAAGHALEVSTESDGPVSINLVVAGAGELVGLRAARGVEPNSLYVLEQGGRWPGGRLVASEPLDDDPGWKPVPPGHTVAISGEQMRLEAAL